jgi:uncharacterized protein DUF6978
MLTQSKVNELLHLVKVLVERGPIEFPQSGDFKHLEAKSENGRETFLIDINRKGKIKISKCTYQERYQIVEILLRVDLDGPTHDNPDGTEVPCPHLHVYREGYEDKWAMPLPPEAFSDPTNLVTTLVDFLRYCKVRDIPEIYGALT